MSVPGAFETPYQSAPLDIASESFYFARKESIEARLREIRNGEAPEILARVDDEHREKKPVCVGVRWDEFTKQDLVEIVTVSSKRSPFHVSAGELIYRPFSVYPVKA